MKHGLRLLLISLLLLSGCSSGVMTERPAADLVLRGGKVATVDAAFSIREAVAVRDDRIVFVGPVDEAAAWVGPRTRVLELGGALVLPGLIDGHAHLHSLGEELTYLNVTGTRSYDDVVRAVAAGAAQAAPGQWLRGGRWDHNDWAEKEFPHHAPLSAVSPHNPVYLSRVDGNSALVNARAMALAGITRDMPDPPGGRIVRDARGEPTGVLINRAMNLVKAVMPADDEDTLRRKFLLAAEDCLARGLTGVHEAGVGPREIALYKRLIDAGEMPLRLYAMLGDQAHPVIEGDLAAWFRQHKILNYGGHHFLDVRCVKLFFDGALGSRGAAFFETYADDPGNTGLLRITPDYISEVTRAALAEGMQVGTHCIGIRGNRLCLEAYGRALAEVPAGDYRLRIEHAQIVRPEDVALFASLGVLPAMQPTHCTSDMPFVEERIGPQRARGAYAWRWFRDAGLVIPCGSDFPVESNDPLKGIYAAVTRQDEEGAPAAGWYPEQRLTREEAIRGFTLWAAYGAFQEERLGSIEVGKLADFTILDTDILTAPPPEILAADVLYTIVGGQIRYAR